MTTFTAPQDFDGNFPPMDGVTFITNGDTITTTRDLTPEETTTVQNWLDAFDPLAAIKIVARQTVKDRALLEMNNLDNTLNWGEVGTKLTLDEPLMYMLAGKPTNPSPAQYSIANLWRVRRGETLVQTLNWMVEMYLGVKNGTVDNLGVAGIIDVWNNKLAAINNAATIEDVQAIIDGLL